MEEDERKLLEILKLTERLFDTVTHQEMVDIILQKAVAIFNCRVCLISLKKEELVVENGLPFWGHGIGETISSKRGERFLKGIINSGHTVVIDDPLADKRLDYLRLLVERYKISSIIFSPLRCAKGENLGILVFDALENRKFQKKDVKFAKIISHVATLAMKREIREQKEKLEILKDGELRALGINSAVMAHALRNPLVPLGGFAWWIKKTLSRHREKLSEILGEEKMGKLTHFNEQIISEVGRMEYLISTVLELTKPAVLELQKCNLNMLLTEIVEKLRLTPRGNPVFTLKLDDHLDSARLMIDSYRLQTCIDDLVNNALDASATKISISTKKLSKTMCTITVTDNGDGIDQEDIEEVFVLFMTKGKKNGTGLGLPSVRHLIKGHGGEITVESKKGETKFEISLPIPVTK